MKNLLLLILLAFALPVYAANKHPRVAELEDKYKQDADNYLEARFPGLPFSVTVSIDPLRRSLGSTYAPKGEVLPFYALDEETIQDEWDDPTANLYTLSNRVKRVKITIQVPSRLNAEELNELKISLTQVLRLVPARDEIEIYSRKWTLMPNLHIYAIGAGSILLALLLGLFLIAYASTRNVSRALENVQAFLKNSASAVGSKPPGPAAKPQAGTDGAGGSPTGDIRFNDPIKVREVIRHRIDDLMENKDLLRLENLQLLNEFGKEDPHALGALLILFPIEFQKELFSYSKGPHWMEALTNPGEVTMKSLEIVEDLGIVKTTVYQEAWEKLLIQIWRMEDDAQTFLKSLPSEQAFSLLGAMPKFISLPLARTAFPGNWGVLLDTTARFDPIDQKTSVQLFQASLKVMPLNPFSILDIYKKDMELLKFVESVDIRTEQEIYEASPEDSMIRTLRPPFYKLFNQNDEVLAAIKQMFEISDWALALFNVDRSLRSSVESQFSDKERFYYYELLQELDRHHPRLEDIGVMRSNIAETLHNYLHRLSLQATYVAEVEESKNEDSEQAA